MTILRGVICLSVNATVVLYKNHRCQFVKYFQIQ